ncbi:FIST C-terminal domain-containing protein [Oxalobacter vibrioformis]|uniref:FIST C-terminal domain-containing protein n=1 Tax=Oxalobacter vibrioformis TaxID=933080 RepID=A0A9E9P212_9BURK|nr:FIST N-terminal domain-containing protein [Oxalobacter vibrioformis]WAW09432.1 FIST C-terminal domain-containing protein [Oxalobacter vibrioformis]
MLKMLTAYTLETDEADVAVSDILGQLERQSRLLANAVGLIACDVEFIETGVVRALCEQLPFEVAGCTTLTSAVPGAHGQRILSLSVLTSEDVSFSTAISAPLPAEGIGREVENAYEAALSKLPGLPSLILAFTPVMPTISGAVILEHLDTVCNGTPIFGPFSTDYTLAFEESMTILNGEASENTVAFILMHGDVNPRFFVSGSADGNIQKQPAIITKSDGYLLQEVNDMLLSDYLDTLGLKPDNRNAKTAITLPLVVTDETMVPLTRAIYSLTPEGHAICGGKMPVDAALAIGRLDYSAVLEKSTETMRELLAEENINAILMYPCMVRNIMLGPDTDDEIRAIVDMIGDRAPYHLSYAGGEICPMQGSDKRLINCFHNFTFIACVF